MTSVPGNEFWKWTVHVQLIDYGVRSTYKKNTEIRGGKPRLTQHGDHESSSHQVIIVNHRVYHRNFRNNQWIDEQI